MAIQSVDKDKRGKLILISGLVTLFAIFFKISQKSDTLSLIQVSINAGFIALLSYIGLLWAFRFMVTLRSMVYVLSQASLIVFILTVFLEIFVFRRVGRVYEALILLTISGLMFLGTYGSFLMANIFNVAQFKELPLIQVGKTSSFILTILSIYFSTYVMLDSQVNGYVTIMLLSIVYFLLILLHIRHLNVERNVVWKHLITVFILVLLTALAQIVIGGNPLISALVPTVVAYSLINLVVIEKPTVSQKFEYYISTIIAFTLSFFVGR